MPEIYTELTPPTAVTHTLSLPFTSPTTQNIIIAKTTLLQIFTLTEVQTEVTAPVSNSDPTDRRIHHDDEQGDFAADLTLQRSTVESVTKLQLLAEYPLHGAVSGLVPVHRDGQASALLASFRDAKASLLVWDADTHAIQTVSLHYYEREEFVNPVVMPEMLKSDLIADPGNRAAILRFAGDMLAVLPVRRREEDLVLEGVVGGEDEDWDPTVDDTPMRDADANGEGKKDDAREGDAEKVLNNSFVVSVAQLDDAISHVIGLTFLHEYREPTLGILYSPKRTWTGWLEERKDTVCYIVITLDLEQKACTPLMSVQGLPYDLHKVVPLQPPIGGSLLIGSNEIIHVDQAGKTTGVAVNNYYRKATNFGGLADQTDLCYALEGASVVELEGEGGDMLLLLKNGKAAILGFKMDGRNVSGLKITPIANHPGALVGGYVTSAISLGEKRLLIACAEGDTRIMKWKRVGEKKPVTTKALRDDDLGDMDVEDMYNMLDDDVDDDLYGGSTTDLSGARKNVLENNPQALQNKTKGEYIFQTHDRLVNLGPIRNFTLGRPFYPADEREKQKGVHPELEIVTTAGPTETSEDAGLSIFRRSIAPQVVGRFDFPACKALWTVRARSTKPDSAAATDTAAVGEQEQKRSAEEDYERYLFVSKEGETQVFHVNDAFEEVKNTDFETDGETIEVGIVGDGSRLVQVVAEQVRVYDCDMQLAQIVPMADEETGEDGPPVRAAKVCDPYVVLLRDDETVDVHKLDKDMELAPEETAGLKGSKYSCLSVYTAQPGELLPAKPDVTEHHILTVLTTDGWLKIFDITDLSAPLFQTPNLPNLQPFLRHHDASDMDTSTPTTSTIPAITDILLTSLGDHVSTAPHLLIRDSNSDLTIYRPFFPSASSPTISFTKLPNSTISTPRSANPPPFHPMIPLPNIAGYATVFLPGADPSFVLSTHHSLPHLHRLSGSGVRSLASFHTASADRGFIYIDDKGTVRVAQLPADFSYDGPWSTRKIPLGESLRAITWFDPMSVYVASTTKRVPFNLEAEDGAPESVDPAVFYPTVERSSLAVINPMTWTIVDSHEFAHNEVALVVTAIPMEISEHTHEVRTLLAVGTGIFRGEDHSARGAIYVFEVISVVPHPNRPETNRKLKLITREEVKGTVSAICGVNGYLLAAQGQKVMVRGLKEDQSLLPVAFMDMNCYVSVARALDGMVMFGDAVRGGVWFAGFSEEPYRMVVFGKDVGGKGGVGGECVTGEFIVDGEALGFLSADGKGNLLILQYDPEHPKSVAGQRLIRRAAFHVGHEVLAMRALPSSADPSRFQILTATHSGGLAALAAVPENLYRRLNILQNQLMLAEEMRAGLNPKAFRHVRGSEKEAEVVRGVVDMGVLRLWSGLERVRRAETAAKAGLGEGRAEIAAVAAENGLGYL